MLFCFKPFDSYFPLVLLLYTVSFSSFLASCKSHFWYWTIRFLPFFDNIDDFMRNDFGMMLLAIHFFRNINWFFAIANFTFWRCSYWLNLLAGGSCNRISKLHLLSTKSKYLNGYTKRRCTKYKRLLTSKYILP